MIGPYDSIAPLPILDLYDANIMQQAIALAKNMYDVARLDMKDFNKEYGDFLSPIQKDMDWYDLNVTGKVRNAINDLYASGIDPLRSAEGRATISRVINGVDTGKIGFLKLRAQNAVELQKNIDQLKSKNMYNQAFSDMLGENPQNWSEDYIGTTSATPYLDYEQKYGHLFDKMGFEYDEEESKKHPGYNVLTKNKSRMHDILSASRPDLINDAQYRYDLDNIRKSIAERNPQMSQQDIDNLATKTLEDEIVQRNYKGGMQMTEDPIAREDRAYNHQLGLINAREQSKKRLSANTPGFDSNGNPTTKQTKDPLGMVSGISNTAYSMLSGTTDPTKQARYMKENIRNVFNTIFAKLGLSTDKNGADGLPLYKFSGLTRKQAQEAFDIYKSTFGFVIPELDFPEYLSSVGLEEGQGKTQLRRQDIDKLFAGISLLTRSYGYTGNNYYTSKPIRDEISENFDDAKYDIIPSRTAIPVFDRKTKRIQLAAEVHIKKSNDSSDAPDYTLYIKLDGFNTGANDATINKNPVTNLDYDEKTINLTRSISNKLDAKYKASQQKTIDDPVSGTYTGDYTNYMYPLPTDAYFYPQPKVEE